jgi:hypothetical protein
MTHKLQVAPDINYIGRIYGHDGGSPVKFPSAFIVTRITAKCVYVRKLEIEEVSKPNGNGYFNHQNFGKSCIKKPLNMVGEEMRCKPYALVVANGGVEYIGHGNSIMFRTHEDVVWSTITPESSVWEKVGK